MDNKDRLHLATRIHFILLRELGSGIDVDLMLKRELYALDVINVCRAIDNDELSRLTELFIEASRAPQFAWSRTTAFGDSISPGNLLVEAPATPVAGWRQYVHSLLRRSNSEPSVT
jgi:hypothetical protein